MKIKIALADQIAEAERYRDEMIRANADQTIINRAEAIILSLCFLQAYEQQFREVFMQLRSTNHKSEG